MGRDRRHDHRAAVVVQAQELGLASLRVYRISWSTNVERIAFAAGHKGLAIEWIDVDPQDRSPVEEASGQPLVPVLVHGDEVVTDSPRILDWLEARFPEPPLYPIEPSRRAEAAIFVQWFNRVWKIAPNMLADEGPDEAWRAELAASVPIFEALLAGRDYLFGDFGIADIVAFPFLKYPVLGLPEGDAEVFHRVLAEDIPLRPDSPLHDWARRVDARPRG
jgi:RNA polymerase-associated protein